ncbi:MAG: hypothetical protein ABWX96_10805 [Propionibacteriaceae bacterium]
MVDPVPTGSEASAGTYRCTSCGYPLEVGSMKPLSPCPSCHNRFWERLVDRDPRAGLTSIGTTTI